MQGVEVSLNNITVQLWNENNDILSSEEIRVIDDFCIRFLSSFTQGSIVLERNSGERKIEVVCRGVVIHTIDYAGILDGTATNNPVHGSITIL